MKKFLLFSLIFFSLILLSGQVWALTIDDPSSADYDGSTNISGSAFTDDQWAAANQNSINGIIQWLNTNEGTNITIPEIYKNDVDDGDSGSYQNLFDTAYFNEPNDPSEATITYSGTEAIEDAWLLVKDGNHADYWYLFDLASLSWNGIGDNQLVLSNFWIDDPATEAKEGGAISHVTLYAKNTPVPEPATMALFGIGLLGLAGVSRRIKE